MENDILTLTYIYLMAIVNQRWKTEAIEKCDVMVYTKIFLKFPHKFWPSGPEKEFFIYAHERRGYYTFWQVGLHFLFSACLLPLDGKTYNNCLQIFD